jgi:GGDEF domain-containing protein
VAGHLLVLRDITERKRAERHLEHLAHYDSVTGLPNRKLFTDRLEQALARPPQWGRPGGAVLRPRPVQGDQ